MAGVDVAVVGAGIVGCAVARACARRGASVVLLERDRPGAHASGGAAGMLAPCTEAEMPGPFLDLARASLGMWPSFAAALFEEGGRDAELSRSGVLRVALDAEAAALLRRRMAWQQRHGIACAWLAADEARAREPSLGEVAGALLYADEGHAHSARTVEALVAAARALGARIVSGARATGMDGRGRVAVAGQEPVAAGVVVVATGPWLPELAPGIPVRPVRGQLVRLARPPRLPSTVVYAGALGYALAKRDGSVLVGTTEEDAGFDTSHLGTAMTAVLARMVTRILPGMGAQAPPDLAPCTWAGLRPATPDRLPILGDLPGTPGGHAEGGALGATRLLVAGGHHRNGVLLAPATGEGIAGMALDGTPPAGWEAFRPGRFS